MNDGRRIGRVITKLYFLIALMVVALFSTIGIVYAVSGITVIEPNGNEAWAGTHDIRWAFSGSSVSGFELNIVQKAPAFA